MAVVKLVTTLPISWKEFEVGDWANTLLSGKNVACIQIEKIKSMYSWQNSISSEEEWRLTMTTTSELINQLIATIESIHPYEIPQIVWHAVNSENSYSNWIKEATSDE
ncbi:MAG: cytochrome C biogenesis protein [Euryarchaeota archaeon]|nr:cytochrome C biogenesis protein [Euryarchaeota archaeon]